MNDICIECASEILDMTGWYEGHGPFCLVCYTEFKKQYELDLKELRGL